MAKSGIHIKASHKGRFGAWEKRHGYTPGSKAGLQAGLHSNNPHVRKMANFARNAKHFKH